MSEDKLCILLSDSRANNFIKFPQPYDLTIKYIVQRGGKINDLKSKLFSFLKSLPSNKVPIIQIAVGINDLLLLQSHPKGKVIVPSATNKDTVVAQFRCLKSEVHDIFPQALVSFITIPPACFKDFQQEKSTTTVLSASVLSEHQTAHNNLIIELNSNIRYLNTEKQNSVGAWTVDWASHVVKKHKKRRGRSRKVKTVYSFHFEHLYDGLHGKSDVKKEWFKQIVTGFRENIKKLETTETEGSSAVVNSSWCSEEEIDEDDRDWKRLKRHN